MLKYSSYQSIHRVPCSQGAAIMNKHNTNKLRIYKSVWRVLTVTVLLMLMFTVAVKAFESSDQSEPIVTTETVIVQSGDTLWQLAVQYKPGDWDTRKFVQAIQMVNEMPNSVIRAGDVILIPVIE